jgi:hypothetical protein
MSDPTIPTPVLIDEQPSDSLRGRLCDALGQYERTYRHTPDSLHVPPGREKDFEAMSDNDIGEKWQNGGVKQEPRIIGVPVVWDSPHEFSFR